MFKKLIRYIAIVLVVASCSSKPKHLISKDNMVAILIDASFINAATGVNRITIEAYGANLNAYIYKKHGIDSLQFATSNNYYASHIKDYEDILDRVIDSLERLKSSLKDIEAIETKENEKRIKDSVAAHLPL